MNYLIYHDLSTRFQCLISSTTPLVITPHPISLHFLSILLLRATFSPGDVQTAIIN